MDQGNVQVEGDVCYLSLVERHRGTGAVVNGFVSGFGYTGSMAIASSVAHDSHHMIVAGTNQEMMASAANRLGEVGGGVSLWKDGAEVALVELPIAGLMSDRERTTRCNCRYRCDSVAKSKTAGKDIKR